MVPFDPGSARANVAVEPGANRVQPASGRRLGDAQRPDRPPDPADPPEPGVAGEIVAIRAAPSAAAAGAGREARRLLPGRRPAGASLSAIDTRTRGGSALPTGARVSRRSPFAASVSTRSTLPENVTIAGRSRRGAATQSERTQIKAQPRHKASPNQPKRPLGAPSPRGPAEQRQPGREEQEARPLARPGKPEPGGDAAAEADHEPRRKLPALALEPAFRACRAHLVRRPRHSAAAPGGRGASAMLGALTHSIEPKTKESALERKHQSTRTDRSSRASRPRRPDSCISAARARPCSTGCSPAITAANICCGSRIPTAPARPSRRSTPSSTASNGSGSVATASPISSRNSRPATPRSRTNLIERGAAYRCYLTTEELTARREKAQAERRPFRIDSEWRDCDPASAPKTRPSSSA